MWLLKLVTSNYFFFFSEWKLYLLQIFLVFSSTTTIDYLPMRSVTIWTFRQVPHRIPNGPKQILPLSYRSYARGKGESLSVLSRNTQYYGRVLIGIRRTQLGRKRSKDGRFREERGGGGGVDAIRRKPQTILFKRDRFENFEAKLADETWIWWSLRKKIFLINFKDWMFLDGELCQRKWGFAMLIIPCKYG